MNKFDYGIFTQVRYKQNREFISQGWKLHCSGTIDNYKEILTIVKDECNLEKIDYKYVREYKSIQYRISGDCPTPAFGKLITIYPNSIESFILIANKLYHRFLKFKGPYILSDKPVYDSEVLYYRYGAFDRDDGYILDSKTGLFIDDNRMYFWVPEFTSDPLDYNDNEKAKIINNTVIPEKIINSSSAGNTYLGKFKNNEVIIKEGRNLVISSKGSAKKDVEREIHTINLMKNKIIVPKIIKVFDEFNNKYVVEEKISGVTLDIWCAKDYAEIKNNLSMVFKCIIRTIKRLHENGIVLQDVSPSNFLIKEVDGDIKNVIICDFGSAHHFNEKWSVSDGSTVGFYDSRSKKLNPFEQDFHKIGYLFMSMIFPFNNLLMTDSTGDRTWELFLMFCHEKNVSSDHIEIIKKLIKTHLEIDMKIGDINTSALPNKNNIKILLDELLDNKLNKRHRINLNLMNREDTYEYIDTINDIGLNGGLSSIGMTLLLNKNICTEYHDYILSRIDRIIMESRNDAYLGIEKGILGSLLYKIIYSIRISDEKKIQSHISELIDFKYRLKYKNKKIAGMTTKSNNNIFSPYIMDGLSGYVILLYLFIDYSNISNRRKIINVINDCLDVIMKESWTKHAGIGYGLSGLLYTVLLAKDYYHDSKRLNNYINRVYLVITKMVCFENKIIVHDRYNNDIDYSFTNGAKGILYLLNLNNRK